jgi:MFS family permease
MSAITMTVPVTVVARPRLVNGSLLRVFVADFAGLTSFYLLLSVVPQYAAAGAGRVGAGLATGVLMLSTAAAELIVPRLGNRFGYRPVLAVGLVLLGAPALALPLSAALPLVVAVCLLRGVGLAILFVACAALSAELIPAERRGEGLGVFGVVAGLPAVLALPLGLWLQARLGYPLVFTTGAIAALAGLAVLPGLPRRRPTTGSTMGVVAGLRTPALLRPSIVFAGSTMAAGIVATFLPVALPHASGALVPMAFLLQAAAATVSRWWAGRLGDRYGAARLLVPGVLVAAAGMLALALTASPVAVLAGAVLFGTGFGAVQNTSMAMMFERVSAAGYGAVSALWNFAYDAGFGAGAAGFGALAGRTGYPFGFALTAAAMLAALVALARSRRTGRATIAGR